MKQKISAIAVKLKETGKAILPFGLISVLLIMGSFGNAKHNYQVCRKVIVNIQDAEDYGFVNQKDVIETASKKGKIDLERYMRNDVDLPSLEKRLLHNPFIKDAQAFFDMQGRLVINVSQRVPLVRFINKKGEQYYIDADGKRMPLSNDYTAYVPVATWEQDSFPLPSNIDSFSRSIDSSLFVLASYTQTDSFAKAITGQVTINTKGNIKLIPRLGNFTIELGDNTELPEKFRRLKSFYRDILPSTGWSTYKTINVKFKNQIVATR